MTPAPHPKTPDSRPPELRAVRRKATGRASQILPAFLRVICRSRIDCTPQEIIDDMRDDSLANLKLAQQNLPDYKFIREHIAILEQYTPEQLSELIKSEIEHQTPNSPYLIPICRMTERGMGGKKACWICSVIACAINRCRPTFVDAPTPTHSIWKKAPGRPPKAKPDPYRRQSETHQS